MPTESWKRILVLAVIGVACEVLFGCQLWFAPGWANGWPFGLTIHAIWSGGMAVMLFLLVMTAAAGLGAAIGCVCSWRGIGLRFGRPIYIASLVIAAAIAFVFCLAVFHGAHETTLRMWPNGYPNRLAK